MGRRKPMVGLAGGIGSGKSEVAALLAAMGAGVIDSDAISRQEIEKRDVKETLVRWWGPEIVRPDGGVDRARVATIVFGDEVEKSRLEALLHPRVTVRRQELIEQYEANPDIRMIVIDSPLLFETGLDRLCDYVLFVEAADEARAERSEAGRGWCRAEWERREKTQHPLDFKRARADYICRNNSDVVALRREVEAIFSRIVSGANSAV